MHTICFAIISNRYIVQSIVKYPIIIIFLCQTSMVLKYIILNKKHELSHSNFKKVQHKTESHRTDFPDQWVQRINSNVILSVQRDQIMRKISKPQQFQFTTNNLLLELTNRALLDYVMFVLLNTFATRLPESIHASSSVDLSMRRWMLCVAHAELLTGLSSSSNQRLCFYCWT